MRHFHSFSWYSQISNPSTNTRNDDFDDDFASEEDNVSLVRFQAAVEDENVFAVESEEPAKAVETATLSPAITVTEPDVTTTSTSTTILSLDLLESSTASVDPTTTIDAKQDAEKLKEEISNELV